MDARPLTIGKVFGQDRRHVVPLFQRKYVWNRQEQWEPLWEDVRSVAERLLAGHATRPHFLGAIVLDQLRTPTGQVETRVIIDGQQRLTTIQLLLEAFADYCAVNKIEKHHKALLKLTRNDDPLSDNEDEAFKVWPTNQDREHFKRVMVAASPGVLCREYGKKALVEAVGQSLADAYLFFYERIEEWMRPEEEAQQRVEKLYQTMKDYLRMVVIDLDKDDDAQLIFETLNARGTPLQPSDLVKNFLFHQAQQAHENVEQLHAKYWQPFDDASEYWSRKLGRGHARRARLDTFLLHYLTLRTRDDVGVAHLYSAFRDYLTRDDAEKPREALESIVKYSKVYRSFDEMKPGTRPALFFERLKAMDISTAYPFLMEVYARFGSDDPATLAILTDLESYLVRRMVCQLNTRGYNKTFVDLLKTLESAKKDPAADARAYLLSSDADSMRWPTDDDFAAAWIGFPLYRNLQQQRVRFMLEALERHLHTGKTEKLRFDEKLTIEHLLPQEWRKHWPLPEGSSDEKAETARERWLHTLGNLTLVTGKLNPALSNGPWESKRKEILLHSALNLNRDLGKADTWGEKAIQERSAQLFLLATEIWPRPKK